MKRRLLWIIVAASFTGTACEVGLPAGKEPHSEFNWTDMGNQPKVKPQREDPFGTLPTGMLAPPPGSVATGEYPYPFEQAEADAAAVTYENPYPEATPAVLARGKWVFEHYCIPCHGFEAAGDGPVTKLFPKPPSLMRQKVRDYSDARIFHVPMRGQASMPRYSKQIEPFELWAVVHYIRDLQARLPVAPPTKQDLEQQPGGAAPSGGGN